MTRRTLIALTACVCSGVAQSGQNPAATPTYGLPGGAAAAPNPLAGLAADAAQSPVATNGVYQYSTAPGTDDTAAIVKLVNALNLPTMPVGAITEAGVGNTYQKTLQLVGGSYVKVTSWPAMPAGTTLDCNNSLIIVTSSSGSGPAWANTNPGDTFGSNNNTEKNCVVLHAGSATGTGTGTAMITGTQNRMENVVAYGFNIGINLVGQNYGFFSNIQAAHNNIGVACLAGTTGVPGTAGGGYPTVDAVIHGVFSRNNKVGLVLDGCHTTTIDKGTLSFNQVIDLAGGAIDFGFVDTFSLSGPSSCPANARIPIIVADSAASRQAQGYFTTDSSGHYIAAFQTNGGRGHVQGSISAAAGNVLGTSTGCTTAPTITPHVTSLAGLLPYSGASPAPTAQVDLYNINFENEGVDANGVAGKNITGFQVVLGPTTSDIRLHRGVSGIDADPTRYQRFWVSDGLNNAVVEPLLGNSIPTDPATGSICPLMISQPSAINLAPQSGTPDNMTCNTAGAVLSNYNVQMEGWKQNFKRTHGYSVQGSGAGNAQYETAFESDEPGDTAERWHSTPSGDQLYGPGVKSTDGQGNPIAGTDAPDVQTGRTGLTSMGVGQWGFKTGVFTPTPVYLGDVGSAPAIALTFLSHGGALWSGPLFSLTSNNIPGALACNATWRWTGNGSGISTWTYHVIAICNDGYAAGPLVYMSDGHTLGNEYFTKQ